MTATITRSTGIIPKVNGRVVMCFPLPGGGYTGKTKKLDRAVLRGAAWLRDTFKRSITIRFNADRHSGGAWLVDKAHRDASVEIGAQFVVPPAIWAKWKALPSPRWQHFEDFWHPDETTAIKHTAYLCRDFLLDPTIIQDDSDYISEPFASSTQAHRWLLRHVDMAKVQRFIPAPQGVSAHV